MSELNDQLKNALKISLTNMAETYPADVLSKVYDLINEIALTIPMYTLNDEVIKTGIWGVFRSDKDQRFIDAVMSTSTTFLLELDNVEKCVEYVAIRLIPIQKAENPIADTEVIEKIPTDISPAIYRNNFLLFLLYASKQMAIVNTCLKRFIISSKE